MTNIIPVMDDPLGAHWRQPSDIRQCPMDDTHVLLTPAQASGLCQYNTSNPSGVYPGKCWARVHPDMQLLVWWGEEIDGKCRAHIRDILVVS